jgi:two-component system, cell cycle sensor histidine kinase and response regulator CckA
MTRLRTPLLALLVAVAVLAFCVQAAQPARGPIAPASPAASVVAPSAESAVSAAAPSAAAPSAAAPSAPSAPTSAVPAPTPAGGPLLFLGNRNIAPVVYLDGTAPAGLAVDLVRALATHIPRPIEIRAMDWKEAQGLVAAGQADALIQINATEERTKTYDFSDALLESHFAIFVRQDRTGIAGISTLHGLRVGVESGGLPQQLLGKDPQIALTLIPSFPEGFAALVGGSLDAVVVDYRVGSYVLATNGIGGIKTAGDPIASSWSSIAVRKGNAALLDAINGALRAIKDDGTYQRILAAWASTEGIFETRGQINDRVYLTAIIGLAILLAVALVWALTLRRQVRRRRAAEVRQREEHFTLRGIIDGVPALIFSLDRQYRYTSFNAAHAAVMKTIYGAEIEQGHSILDYASVREDRQAMVINLDRALAGETVVEEGWSGEEIRSRQFFRVSHSPIRSDGEIIGVAMLAQDTTERKEADDSLRRLNRELRALSDCNEAVVRADDERTLLGDICRIICDEAGYRMAWVGYAEQDEARTVRPAAWAGTEDGYLAAAAITWADGERGRGPTGTAIRSGRATTCQDFETDPLAAVWREDALQRGYRSSVALPLKDRTGSSFATLTIYAAEPNAFTPEEVRLLGELASDLAFGMMVLRTRAEQKTAEQSLHASEERYRRFVEDDVAGVFVTTVDGQVLTCNPAFARMFGFASVEQALAINVVTIYESPAAREAVLDELRASRRFDQREMTWRRNDGSPVIAIETAIGDFDEAGELVAIRGYVIDVTERKRLEDQLRQAQKMEAIGRLAGGVAHDFNNLLTAINGYADILVADMTPDEPRRADVEEIRKAGDRAAALTRQLIAFSRRQVLQPVVIDLNDVVAGIVPMLRRLVGEQIELRVSPAADLGHVRADPPQLEQVLLNLVVNARDAMPAGGALTIETANVELDEQYVQVHATVVAGPYVMLAVTDTGSGMDAVTMAHLFEPFFTTKPSGQGTGLGLATVYGIVVQSGGHVAASSEPGHGAVFRIYLPRVTAEVEAKPDVTGGLARGGSERILVVEDEDAVRAYVERVLAGLGYRVITARSGSEALALVGQALRPIHLLVTDFMLPGMNGREISERLSARDPSLRTLFISGYTEDSIVHEGMLEPGVAFLGKPFTPEALARAVRDVLGARQVVKSGPGR